ncbi:hypothetical protein MTO96_013167 [Rhipicephalus appendiculatus]
MTDRSTGRQCRSHDQTDEATPATMSMTSFRPSCRDNLGALPSLGYYRKSLAEHRRFDDGARQMHEAFVTLTTDAAAKPHRGCLEDRDYTPWLDLQWFSSSAFQPAVRKTILCRKMAVVSHRRVATTNTRRVSDGSAVNSEPPEAYALHLSQKTTNTPGLQEVVPGHTSRTGGSLKRRSAVTYTDGTGVKDESSTAKTPLLEVQESRTTGPTDACKVSAPSQAPAAVDSKTKDSRMKKLMDHRRHRASVNDAWVVDVLPYEFFGARERDVENDGCRLPPETFRTETYTDWPRRRSTVLKTHHKKAQADKVALGRLIQRCARKIKFLCTQLCRSLISPPSARYGRYG